MYVWEKKKEQDRERLISDSVSEVESDSEPELRVSLRKNLDTVKKNLYSTLDPYSLGDGISLRQFEDNVKRNYAIIAMMILVETLEIKTIEGSVKISASSSVFNDVGDLHVSDVASSYIGMGGRLSVRFNPKGHEKC